MTHLLSTSSIVSGRRGFSGKDPTKVDHSGAYIVRQVAKSVVFAFLVLVSYAIGVPKPLSVFDDIYGNKVCWYSTVNIHGI